MSGPVVFLLSMLAITSCWAECDLDDKFAELERKLDYIIARLDGETVTPTELELETTTIPPTPSSSTPSEPKSVIPSVIPWITPLEVRRDPEGEEDVTFTIRFKAAGSGRFEWAPYTSSVVAGKISSSPDIQELTYTTQPQNASDNSFVVINLYSSDESMAGMAMSFNNDVKSQDVISDIKLPTFGIDPPGDFVFQRGESMTMQLSLPPLGFNSDKFPPGFHAQMVLLDRQTDELTTYFVPRDDIFEILESEYTANTSRLTVRIDTAESDISGLIDFSVSDVNLHGGALLSHLSIVKRVVLRPHTQTGPFPYGYLGFQADMFTEREDGALVYQCSVGGRCKLPCVAVGEDIKNVALVRVRSDGSRTMTETEAKELPKYVVIRQASIPSQTPGNDTYMCWAENSQRIVTLTVQVTYTVPIDILEDQSGVRVLNEHEDTTIRRLALVCTVRGYPTPKVTFSTTQPLYAVDFLVPDEILETDDYVITATKFVTFDTADPYGERGVSFGELTSASCKAKNPSTSNDFWAYDDYYAFDIPHDE